MTLADSSYLDDFTLNVVKHALHSLDEGFWYLTILSLQIWKEDLHISVYLFDAMRDKSGDFRKYSILIYICDLHYTGTIFCNPWIHKNLGASLLDGQPWCFSSTRVYHRNWQSFDMMVNANQYNFLESKKTNLFCLQRRGQKEGGEVQGLLPEIILLCHWTRQQCRNTTNCC